MSIIIRLQYLPWNANAADIRQFFHNLTIPDGGVHIVGGENGDAFIAFGSDEDARQAMLMDGGKIKDVKIKLLLSSRTEMQKVIELARQQALTLQNLMQTMAAASTFGTPNLSSILPNLLPNMPSLSSVTNSINSINQESKPVEIDFSKEKNDDKKRSSSRSRSRSRSSSRNRSRSRSRSRSYDRRYRDKYRHRNRSRDHKWRRERSRSRDRSRSKDRYNKRSRSHEKRKEESKDKDYYRSKDRRRSYDKKDKSEKSSEERTSRRSSDIKFKSLNEIPVSLSEQEKSKQNQIVSPKTVIKSEVKETTQKDKTENTNTRNSPNWMSNVPKPPIISSWMLSQTNEKPQTTEAEKKKPNSKINQEKTEITPPMPFGMFPTQFPFAHGYPTPLYSLPGYPTNPTGTPFMNNEQRMPSVGNVPPPMPPIPVPTFYNPFQSNTLSTTQIPSTPVISASVASVVNSFAKETGGNSQKKEINSETSGLINLNDEFDRSFKQSGNYHESNDERNYNSNFRNDYKSKNEYNYDSYEYPKRKYEDENDYRNYSKRSYSDTRNNSWNEDKYDRKDNYRNYDYSENKKNSYTSTYYSGSPCVEMSNLPLNAVVFDVKKFFSPLPLYENCIKFQHDDKSPTKTAVIKFLSFNLKMQALQYKGKFLRSNRINLTDISLEKWEATEDVTIAQVDKEFLKVMFIPKRAQKTDVIAAFHNPPNDVILMKDKFRDALVSYLKFSDKMQVKVALSEKNKILICGSRVKLEPITEEDFLLAKADYQISSDSPEENVSTNDTLAQDSEKSHKRTSRWTDGPETKNSELNEDGHESKKYYGYATKDNRNFNNYSTHNSEDHSKLYNFDGDNDSHCSNSNDSSSDLKEHNSNGDVPQEQNLEEHITENLSNPKFKPDSNSDNEKVEQKCETRQESSLEGVEESNAEIDENTDLNPDVEEYEPQTKLSYSDCILMTNLPPNITEPEIVDFLSETEVIPHQIHIMFDENYKQIGNAFCEFSSEGDATKTLDKHKSLLRGNLIDISIVPRDAVQKAIEGWSPDEFSSNSRSKLPSLCSLPLTKSSSYGNLKPFLPRREPPSSRRPGPENFGKPGCVIALENVPYKATIEEILDFFAHFNVKREHVIRRFNENGQPTGDVRICLRSPMEAQKAVKYLSGQRIRERLIYISLV